MTLEDFDFTQDPFPIVPDGPVHNWAGREDLREDLVDLIKGVRARDIGITEFVVLHGELGAGKSHALRYLKTMITEDTQHFESLALYVESPRVATKLNFLELHRYIVHAIGRERIQNYCQAIKKIVDEIVDGLAATANASAIQNKSSFYEQAINGLPVHNRKMIELLMRGAGDDAVFNFLAGTEKCSGNEYEGKIDSDFMAAKVLADLFRALTTEVHGRRVLESIYLFIDEVEVLADAKTSESDLVFNGFRELINGLPYRFGLFISFSAATALIEAVMPQHLLKRMTRPYIEVPMLDDATAVEFLRLQMNFFRTANSLHQGTCYPFSLETIQYIVQNTTTLTPRNLFIECKRVLERAIRRHDLQPGSVITPDVAESILQGYR